jgi:hypothetical protein
MITDKKKSLTQRPVFLALLCGVLLGVFTAWQFKGASAGQANDEFISLCVVFVATGITIGTAIYTKRKSGS